MKWNNLYKGSEEEKEMTSFTCRSYITGHEYKNHKFKVGDDVLILAPTDGGLVEAPRLGLVRGKTS